MESRGSMSFGSVFRQSARWIDRSITAPRKRRRSRSCTGCRSTSTPCRPCSTAPGNALPPRSRICGPNATNLPSFLRATPLIRRFLVQGNIRVSFFNAGQTALAFSSYAREIILSARLGLRFTSISRFLALPRLLLIDHLFLAFFEKSTPFPHTWSRW